MVKRDFRLPQPPQAGGNVPISPRPSSYSLLSDPQRLAMLKAFKDCHDKEKAERDAIRAELDDVAQEIRKQGKCPSIVNPPRDPRSQDQHGNRIVQRASHVCGKAAPYVGHCLQHYLAGRARMDKRKHMFSYRDVPFGSMSPKQLRGFGKVPLREDLGAIIAFLRLLDPSSPLPDPVTIPRPKRPLLTRRKQNQ